jgi:hypothetical protein
MTWEYQTLPSPLEDPNLIQNSYCITHTPYLFSPKTASLAVECRLGGDSEETLSFLYTTNNAGEIWISTPTPGNSLQLLSQMNGFSFGPDIYKTENSGQTWELVSSVDWVAQYLFIDHVRGWALVEADEDNLLFHTSDGGSNWSIIYPEVLY